MILDARMKARRIKLIKNRVGEMVPECSRVQEGWILRVGI